VKDVRRFVHQKVIEAARLVEVSRCQIAGCLLAQAGKTGGIFREEIGATVRQIEIRKIPGRTEPRCLLKYTINGGRCQKND
jgi:hypothetical protein